MVLIPGLDVEGEESCKDVSRIQVGGEVDNHEQPKSVNTVLHP